MKKMGKYIGMIALLFVLCIAKNSQTAKAADTMTMTELYNSKDYEEARANERTITVSSLGEFTMFQKAAVEDARGLRGLSFVQTQDIIASECTFSYDKDKSTIIIWQDGSIYGYIDEYYNVYDKQKQKTTYDALGLEDALSYDRGTKPVTIYGNYDGNNHLLKGFFIGNVGKTTQQYGGLFANTSSKIKNLHITDCCVLGSYGTVANVAYSGSISNVLVERCYSVGYNAACLVGWVFTYTVVSNCVARDSMVILNDHITTEYSLGGIATKINGGTIQNCVAWDVEIYSKNMVDDPAGGIVGLASSATGSKIINCVSNCTIDNFMKSGGIIGETLDEVSVQIMNCTSLGTIGENIVTEGMSGGLLGAVYGKNTVDIINSASLMKIKSKEYSGGIVGRVLNDNAVVNVENCLFAGSVSSEMKIGGISARFKNNKATKCYAVQTAGDLFGDSDGEIKECYSISDKQLLGTETENVITATGEYQGKYSVIDMLNQYILETDQVSLTEWTALSNGIPVPRSSQKQIAKILNGSTNDNGSDDTPVISPTAVPSATPVTSPTAVPSATPIISPTTVPNGDKTDNTKDDTSSDQSGIGSNTSNGNTALASNTSLDTTQRKTVSVSRAKAEALSNKVVKFTWDKKSNFSKMILYYSTDGRKYKKITTCNSKKHAYTWKAGKPGKKYYFRFVTYQLQDGRQVKGRIVTKKLLLPTLKTPTYQLSIGKSGNQKYMQIKLKRYQGRYVEISLKKGNATFKKAPMVSDKIAYYHGKILFTYKKGGVTYSCKLRTYLIKNGRKKYSAYSKVKKIRI